MDRLASKNAKLARASARRAAPTARVKRTTVRHASATTALHAAKPMLHITKTRRARGKDSAAIATTEFALATAQRGDACSRDSAERCSVHGATWLRKPRTMPLMETTKTIRNETARRNRRREVTLEILRTKHEVFTAAAEEIARRAKKPVSAETVMAFLLEAECDAKDIADLHCSRVLH